MSRPVPRRCVSEALADSSFDANTDRQWRIVVDTRGGGLGSGTPAVEVGWHPAQLTFVACGNAVMPSAATERDVLVVGATATIMTARVGAMQTDQSNVAPVVERVSADSDALRRYVLWGALVIAVEALNAMEVRLARGEIVRGGEDER
ncbi:DUF3999 family protein [Paraburkholderia dinghuensis]